MLLSRTFIAFLCFVITTEAENRIEQREGSHRISGYFLDVPKLKTKNETNPTPFFTDSWTKKQAYGYGTIANAVLSATALGGIFLIICSSYNQRESGYLSDFFVSLAISTMMGDAMFHILPEMLGLHELLEREDFVRLVIGKLSVAAAMIYIFWMFETVIGIWTWKREIAEERKLHPEKFETEENEKETQQEVTSFDEEKDIELRTGSLIGVIVGETLHKFVDGLAMGVSWAVGWKVGLTTFMAMILHDAPHELGDFVIFTKFGLSNTRALVINTCIACTSFGGLYLGLGLAEFTESATWLLGCVVGLFIYLPLVDMLPEAKIEKGAKNAYKRFLVQNLGWVSGFAILILISVYEDVWATED